MFKKVYLVTMIFLGFTGLAQLPVMKRYYVNEVPLLSWAGDFYITLTVHYLAAIVLLALTFFAGVNFFLARRGEVRLTRTGAIRVGLLAGIVGSGALMVVKHLPGVYLAKNFITGLDLVHLGLAMTFMLLALGCLIARAKWTRPVAVPVRVSDRR